MPSIEISEEHGVRYLHFGSSWVQGAMRIARPWALELEYTREMMLPLILNPGEQWPASVLQVGLGSASITKFLYRHRPKARITVVEIMPQVVAAARQFFKLPDDSDRLRIEIGEASEYVASGKRRFDLILVDGFDENGRTGMLDTVPFYLNCLARLGPGGMIVTNHLRREAGVYASVQRMRQAFERVVVLPPCEAGNIVALSAREAPIRQSPDVLHAAAIRLKADTGLDLLPTVARMRACMGPRGK